MAAWREIALTIEAKIQSGEHKPGDQLPSNVALAAIHGVSRLTAHKALEDLQRRGLITRQGRRGTIVADRRKAATARIALILDQVDFLQNFPRKELLKGIYDGLGTTHSLVLCDSKTDPAREEQLLLQMAETCDGVICWPCDHSSSAPVINQLAAAKRPLVLLDRVPSGAGADAVVFDSGLGVREALNFLVGRGHEKIALFTFDKPEVSTVAERCLAYQEVMEEHGLDGRSLIRRLPEALEVEERDFLEQAIQDALFALVKGPEKATAVVCVQDLLGVSVLKAAHKLGFSIPQDLEVVTFNDWPAWWLETPWQAHRITFDVEEMGQAAIAQVMARLSGDESEPAICSLQPKFEPADSLFTDEFDSAIPETKEGSNP